jgi:molybdopterin-guanine dinucleotide biosynthesis protein A
MNMEIINKIEAQISELESRLKKNNEFIVNANASLEKLSTDKASVLGDSNIINGALQAFGAVLKELKEPKVAAEAEVIPADAE